MTLCPCTGLCLEGLRALRLVAFEKADGCPEVLPLPRLRLCHRRGGGGRGLLDARLEKRLGEAAGFDRFFFFFGGGVGGFWVFGRFFCGAFSVIIPGCSSCFFCGREGADSGEVDEIFEIFI